MERNNKNYYLSMISHMVSDGVGQIKLNNRVNRRTRIKGKTTKLYLVAAIRVPENKSRSRLSVPEYLVGTIVPLYKTDKGMVYYEVPVKFMKTKKKVVLNKTAKEALTEFVGGY